MSDNGSYRIHMRLRRTEYGDVIADIESYPESEQYARIKRLLRLGLAADTANAGGAIMVSTGAEKVISPAAQARPTRTERHPRETTGADAKFDALGLDPATFSFGAKMS
jgi:hypothetical protein